MPRNEWPDDDPLPERLSRALGARYRVEGTLGAGGMGKVYLARDLTLDRRVAVKVIPPELATARAVERFRREARTLADLTHPNVVPVYDFGESEGLLYYTMQYIEGETVKARIERGPMATAETLGVATQLLEALEAVHRRGIVHRDVKPSNMMLVDARLVLVDFGISKRMTSSDETLTEPDGFIGTHGYTAPEAMSGEATAQSDLYSAGIVIYECLTGREWLGTGEPDAADWSDVPADLRGPLVRALALDSANRWPNAARFKKALLRRGPRWPTWTRVGGAAALAAVAVSSLLWIAWPRGTSSQLLIVVPRFAYTGPPATRWVADSITEQVRRSLAGADVRVASSPRPWRSGLHVAGEVTVSGDSARVALSTQSIRLPAGVHRQWSQWSALADDAAAQVWGEVWKSSAELGPIPFKVIPHDPLVFERFVHGERAFALARWPVAAEAYARAEDLDSTCLLCSWRLHDVGRWLSTAPDDDRYRRLLLYADSFPPHYRAVIRAAVVPTVSRVDSLRVAVKRWPDFWTAWFHLAEELFHRGPLTGYARREAEAAYVQVTRLRPTFAPAWHHLVWLRTAEGDRAGAEEALAKLAQSGTPEDFFSLAVSGYVTVGFAWRFLPTDSARAVTEGILASPAIDAFPDLGAGARFLVGFDAAQGAIAVARLLEHDRSPTAMRSALLAEVLANVALGRPAAVREAMARLRANFDSPEIGLFAAQLDAVLALFGPADQNAVGPVAPRLGEYLVPLPGAEMQRRRAAYLIALLAGTSSEAMTTSGHDSSLGNEPGVGPLNIEPFSTLLRADSQARRGEFEQAVTTSLALVGSLDSSESVADPFFRTVHHLKRAEWLARLNHVELAYRELGWFENSDIEGGYPTGDPKNVEVDWAFGTEARWRRARLYDGAGHLAPLACAGYRAVVRNWSDGETAYAARADTARERLLALGCPE